ncbi:MAG: ferritin-like domain-containing protein [Methylorubrum rhodinum]|uniref:ferritin-like domain-containing protein n=1 Tax=Methylorubrum rhodinum TaxID=29428 RepID=UPI003BAFE182
MATELFLPKRGPNEDDEPRSIDLAAGRRAFLRTMSLGLAGGALLATDASEPAAAQSVTDFDILNFALNLEYLEAEFYLRAATGAGLQAGDIEGTGTQGAVTGGRAVAFRDATVRGYANEIANDELAHVRFLRQSLGTNRVARPAINLSTAFTAAARAAGLVPANGTFDAFANDANFLIAAFLFEDVGVTAYRGAAPLIASPLYLVASARILAVEGYHSGLVRTLLYQGGYFTQAQGISNARDSLDGSSDLDQGIGNASTVNLVPADANGVAFPRTTSQVLNVVYLNLSTRPGGFFPNGTNGRIR